MPFKNPVKGSILVFSLIVLSVILSAALSITAVTVSNRKSASSTSQSVQSFQVADSGVEKALKEIYKGSYADLSTMASAFGTSCLTGSFSFPVSGGTSTVTFFDTNNAILTCASPTWRNDVAKIKVEGTSAGTTRVIETAVAAPPCNTPTVTDIDGNVYNTVRIGTQCWMKENIMTTKYPDGTSIARGPTGATWSGADNAYYAYPPNVGNTAEESLANIQANKLGFVYQWSAAMKSSVTPGAQGICPDNWHVPTHDEFTMLERAVCTSGTCVTDFPLNTSTSGWRGTNEGSKLSLYTSGGDNSSGFTGILAGNRSTDGSFVGRSASTNLWLSTPGGGGAWYRFLFSGNATVYRNTSANALGLSVRCLKD